MEFWGVEVKIGEPLPIVPGETKVLHLSQACLGESKKDKSNDSVCLYVNVDGKKLVLATLFSEKLPQQQFDLVFDRDFELSHNWKNGSVFFYGYRANNPFEDASIILVAGTSDEDDDSDEDLSLASAGNGKPVTQTKQENPTVKEKANAGKESAAGKPKVKIVEPNKDVKAEEDKDSSDGSDDHMFEDESESDEEDDESGESGDEEDDDESEEDDETPKKVEPPSKKRPAESSTKTPVPDKKAKLATPQKTDGKKGGGHVATPYPSKQSGKTSANKGGTQQTPKSAGSHACKSCSKAFGSEQALDSHTKAKHK